ncbi:C40 family peptidase [Streptomyces olivoreticuli]|uniref:C40 family peptidase n=1 Tax=Streptomyces olivoreticuli TaxID=68246 RepID=UPI001F07BC0A|nr:C40 family peptidase [Streptomyces olivoreticuli]
MDGREVIGMAAGAAGRGLLIKIAVPVAVLGLFGLIAIGLVAGMSGAKAHAASGCGKAGRPDTEYDTTGGPATGSDHAQQLANAKTIDRVASQGGLSGRATLIGLMTGLAESSLLNLDHGDRDSLGVFQQRPSSGWGTKEQIMDVTHAATMFFFGGDSGDPPGLTDIKGWESKTLNDAAQAVQRSGFPDAYTGQENEARSIAEEAGIDIDRTARSGTGRTRDGASSAPSPGQRPGAHEAALADCTDSSQNSPGEPGQAFHDGRASWPGNVKNRRSTEDAIRWARQEASGGSDQWYRMCLAFVATTYGWTFSGTTYAQDHYLDVMPKDMRHDKDRNPPAGALMFWTTGSRAGHVALYVGDGKIASNDIETPGRISIVPATDIETKWGATYLGWSPPYFPQGG